MPAVKLLSTPGIFLGDERIVPPTGKTAALLYYLAYQAAWVSRKDLLYLFWPDTDDAKAMANLRQLLRSLKQLPYLDNLEITPRQLYWSVFTDVQDLQACIKSQSWSRLLELYKGHLMDKFQADEFPEFASWLELERSHLFHLLQEAALTYAQELEANTQYLEAAQVFERLHELEPFDENILRSYLHYLGLSKNANKAQMVFEQFKKRLKLELDLEPTPETYQIIQQLQTKENPPRPLKKTVIMPLPSTQFVGRESEISNLTKQLSNPACRLLTLVAPGGMGKTRLALELGQRLSETFSNGIYFVALEAVHSADMIVPVIIQALSLNQSGQKPPKRELFDFLVDKEILLILDNLEQLNQDLSLIPELLAHAPNLKLLCTSREVLNLQAEWLYDLAGLAVPSNVPDLELEEVDSVRLFIRRTQKTQANFELNDETKTAVISICEQLGGMPLALELAASWLRVLSLKDIQGELERGLELLKTSLSDMPKRHLDMATVFEASWARLGSYEQATLRKLSVFEGGFIKEAALTVTETGLPLLLLLVNKSFIRLNEQKRFVAHPLMWQFIRKKAKENLKENFAARERHASYFLNFAQDRDDFHKRPNVQEIRAELDLDLPNLRHAWQFATEHQREDLLALGNLAIFWHFLTQGRNAEGADFFKEASETLSSESLTHARVLHRYSALLNLYGDHETSRPLLEQSLALKRKHNATWDIGHAVLSLSFNYTFSDYVDTKTQASMWGEAAQHFEKAGDGALQGRVQNHQAEFTVDANERERLLLASEQLLRKQTGYHELSNNLTSLAEHLEYTRGDFEKANRLITESINLERDKGSLANLAIRLTVLGENYIYWGNFESAKLSYLKILSFSKNAYLGSLIYSYQQLALIAFFTQTPTDAQHYLDQAFSLSETYDDLLFLALSNTLLAKLALKTQNPRDALLHSQNAYTYFSNLKNIRLELAWLKALCISTHADCHLANANFLVAKNCLQEALVLALEWGFQTAILHLLVSFAALELNQHNPEVAFSLVALCLDNPAAMAESREKARALFLELPQDLQKDKIKLEIAKKQELIPLMQTLAKTG